MEAESPKTAPNPVIDDIVRALRHVPGIVAIALGGSRSIGTATADSDYDIAVFENNEGDIESESLRQAIQSIADGPIRLTEKLALAEFTIHGQSVELFFRKLSMIAREIENARAGKFGKMQHVLHPHGYLSTIIISYITYARPLWDPHNRLGQLVNQARPYPDALRQKMLATNRMDAALLLKHAGKVRRRDELPYLCGLYSRIVSCWTISLFAVNRRYPVIDKGAQRLIMAFPLHPDKFHGRTIMILREAAAGNLKQAHEMASILHNEVIAFP